jgi:nitric-oxide synthase
MRTVVTTADMFAQCVEHIRVSYNDGAIRPTITIFPPLSPNGGDPEIVSPQLLCYAGYDRPGRRQLGDRRHVDLTAAAISAGWSPPRRRGRFDVLPMLLRDADGQLEARTYPADLVPEVRISHPDYRWFRKLGLRWFGLPVVTDMAMYVGGIVYPAVPFSGWFMGSEIGARDLADRTRYDQLPVIAESMGLDTSRPDTLWADRAVVELTRAVQYSYSQAGVRMTDHHTESVMFSRHIEREERAGRECPADWSWLVPPISGALTGTFHRYYAFHDSSAPQFFRRTPFTEEECAACAQQTFV